MTWRIALVVGVFLACATSARAQFDSATISGVVQDTTGAILPGVDVTKSKRERNVSVTFGSGGPLVRLVTTNGGIHLNKS